MTNEDRAFLFAPLAMPVALVVYTLVADVPGFDFQSGIMSYIGLILAITIVGLPIVYTFEFFVGYRFYRLFLKKKRINLFTLIMGGVILADLPMIMIWLFGGFSSEEISISTAFPLFTFVGFSIGLAFWFLLNPDRFKKRG